MRTDESQSYVKGFDEGGDNLLRRVGLKGEKLIMPPSPQDVLIVGAIETYLTCSVT